MRNSSPRQWPQAHPATSRSKSCNRLPGPPANAPAFGYTLSPEAILGLAVQLDGSTPPAFCATVTGANFEHGESLSPAVAAALPDLINRIRALIEWQSNQNESCESDEED